MNLKKLLTFINIGLCGLLVWLAADIILTWTANPQDENLFPSDAVGSQAGAGLYLKKTKKEADYAAVYRRDIFHTKKQTARIVAAPVKEPAAADLHLILKGTVVGKTPPDAFAIIQAGKKKDEDVYHINDYIEGARITDILPDRIILMINGKTTQLRISENIGPPAPEARPARRPPVRRPTPRRRPGR